MLNILITGVQGFIGCSLAQQLSQKPKQYNLYGIDIREDRLRLPTLQYTKVDIRDKECVWNYFSSHSFDVVIHLAAISRVVDAEQHKHDCISTNYDGTKNIVDYLSSQSPTTHLIFASSREVYGEQLILPVTEDCELKPLNIYGFYKLLAEQYIQSKLNRYNILRFCNVYGNAYDISGRVIPSFIQKAKEHELITIDGGTQFIDFTFINDTIWAICQCLELSATSTINKEIITISPGEGHSLQELIQIIEKESGLKTIYRIGDSRNYDVQRFVGNPAKRIQLLGEHPFLSLAEGIRTMFDSSIR